MTSMKMTVRGAGPGREQCPIAWLRATRMAMLGARYSKVTSA